MLSKFKKMISYFKPSRILVGLKNTPKFLLEVLKKSPTFIWKIVKASPKVIYGLFRRIFLWFLDLNLRKVLTFCWVCIKKVLVWIKVVSLYVFRSFNSKKVSKRRFSTACTIAIFVLVSSVYTIWTLMDKSYEISETAGVQKVYYNTVSPAYESYITTSVTPNALSISFPESIANRELLSAGVIEKGISVTPEVRGKWKFSNAYTLSFMPEKDWQPNMKYEIVFSDELFLDGYELTDSAKKAVFNTLIFSGKYTSAEFYEDPRDIKNKQVVATFSFNYPIKKENLEEKISVKSYSGESYKFTVREDKYLNRFHVATEAVRIKPKEDFVEIKVSGVENAYNNAVKAKDIIAKVKIPSASTFFKIKSIYSSILNNEAKQNEPEQIVFLNFSTSVDEKELLEYIEFYKYEGRCYNLKFKKDENISSHQDLKRVDVAKVSVGSGKNHMFKYDFTTRNQCIVVRIKKGISSLDGFIIDSDIINKLDSSNYPMETDIAFEGSILSLKGDKTLSLSSRGVDEIEVKVSRIDSKDLNHLATQTYGDFSNPIFRNYNFNEDNISENYEKKLKINSEHPAKINYSSVNLGDYFKNNKGMFIVKAKGKNSYSSTSESRRFILITDLGIVVKKNLDNTQNVFVSSISDGLPVSGAKVEVLGKNGVPILESYTNKVGMATIPNFNDFKNEKEPVVFIVRKDSDVSFMPVNKSDRLLDNSRFEVDGEYETTTSSHVKGFMFSDRGIYRPGENAKIGIMVRDQNLEAPNKVPFEVDITNPRGDKVFNKKIWSDEFGLLDISYDVPKTAPIGYYNVSLYDVSDKYTYRRHVYSTSVQVEEFVPDTMKIKTLFEDVPSKGWYNKEELRAKVNLQNLYGNPAIEHEVRANINLNPVSFRFSEYSGYIFKDPLVDSSTHRRSYYENLSNNKTNKKGDTEYAINLADFDRGTYSLSFNTSGYELEGGRSVSASRSVLVSPLDYIVGYKTDGGSMYSITKDAERTIDFIVVDNELNKISKDGLKLKLIKIEYVSSLVEMANGTFKYQNVPVEETIVEKSILIPATGNKLKVDTKTPGSYYILILDDKDAELSRVDYQVEGATNTNYMLDKDANLSVKLNKKEYNNGEIISLKIVSPYEGYGLITIERDKVYNYKWFKTSSKTTTEEIVLPYTVEGNAYINVSFIRSANSREIFMPPMTYAVVPFDVNKAKRTVNISLDVPEIVKPGQDLVVKYKANKKGKIIIYGVNQGILQVSNYKLPNPLAEFIKKKSLNTSTYQIMDLIIPDMRLLDMYKAAGGDDYDENKPLEDLNPFARKQEEVVAFWSGVIDATTDYQEYKYKVPAIFNGQIKVMAVAVSDDSFGSFEKGVYARGDFALVPSSPFNVSPDDVFDVGTSIANMIEGSGNNYDVKVVLETSKGLEVIGDREQKLQITEKDEKSVSYKVKALDKLGSNTLKFIVSAVDDETKNFEMPFNIGIRPASPFVTKVKMGYEERTLKLKDYPMPMYEAFRKQEFTASPSPIVLADGILNFLSEYPHMCSEQMISRTYPVMEVFFKYPELTKGTDIYKLYDRTISLLSERQKMDGGISMWSYSGGYSNEYISLYAYDFLTRAEVLGFNVPKGMLSKLTVYVKEIAGKDARYINDESPAYAIYLLSRAGENTSTYLVNAEKVYKTLGGKNWAESISAKYLASSYKLLKNDDKSRELLGKHKYGESSINDMKYIYLMSNHFDGEIKMLGKEVTRSLLEPLKKQYMTTNLSAHSLFALTSYGKERVKDIKVEGKDMTYDFFARTGVSANDKLIEAKAKDPFYYVIREQGYVRDANLKAQSNFVKVSKEILNEKGTVITSANVGDELTVRLRVNAHKRDSIDNVAITDLLAGGFEMVLDSISANKGLDNAEAREDRAMIYLTLNKSVTTITYKVKAIARGEFIVPGAYVEALYDSDVRANSKADKFIIK